MATVKRYPGLRFEQQPFFRANEEGLRLETSALESGYPWEYVDSLDMHANSRKVDKMNMFDLSNSFSLEEAVKASK